MQTEDRRKRKTGTTGQKIRLIVTSLVALLFLFLMYWWHAAMTAPDVVIPTPKMPTPNAYDTFVSAGSQMMDDAKVGYALSAKHTSGNKDDREYTLKEKDALIAENTPALKTLRDGLTQEYMNPPLRSLNTLMPYYARFRAMARLLELEAQAKEGHGDWSGAMNSRLDAIQLGIQIPRGSPIIGNLVGIACQAIGRRSAWKEVDRLDAKQAKTAAQRLNQTLAGQMPYADSLQEEKWAIQASLLEMFRNPKAAVSTFNANSGGTQIPPAIANLFFLVYSKRSIMRNNAVYMDQLIANAKQPYASHPAPPKTPPDPINQMLLPVFEQAHIKNIDNQAQNNLLLVTLALRAYFVEHGAYPQSLNELAPAYLKTLPEDPFALKGTFQYRRQGSSYLLYSLGPDSKDDNGKMIDDLSKAKSQNPNERYYIREDSAGDIVAGKNVW